MTKRVYKYPFRLLNEEPTELPVGAHLLRVDRQGNNFYVWALVDPDRPMVSRDIQVHPTGTDILETGEGKYINTILDGPYVWHFFDYGEI